MATTAPYNITLLVSDAKTKRGLPGLKVEAWDKDLLIDDLLGSAVTDKEGKATFTFDRKYFAELFADRKPDLYFKVFFNGKLLYNTKDSVTWNISSRMRSLNIEIPSEVKLPDFESMLAIANPDRYTISGTVVGLNGDVLKGRSLVVVDVDLKGAAIYRTVTTRAQLSGEGFEQLGETLSDERGYYSVKFTSEDYAKGERGKADAVVYAVEGDRIIGRSKLVTADDYSDAGEVNDLLVLISKTEGAPEYELLMRKLTLFLEQNNTNLIDLAQSDDQVTFTASELEENKFKIRLLVDAEALRLKVQSTHPVSHELLYGIGRQQVKISWAVLYKKKDAELRALIGSSVQRNLVRTFTEDEIRKFLDAIHAAASAASLSATGPGGTVTLDKLLTNALPEQKQRLAFVNAVRSFSGEHFSEFWSDYLPKDKEFKNNPGLISNLLFNQQLTLITGNNYELINELQVNRKLTTVTQLLEIPAPEWEALIANTGIPGFIKGENETDRVRNYAVQIRNILNAAFPTQKITIMLDRKELPVDGAVRGKMIEFLNTKGFDFSKSRVLDFEDEILDITKGDPEKFTNELKRVQRVFQVSTQPEIMPVLLEHKLDSAYSINSIPKKSFIKMFSGPMGGESEAEAVYERAAFMSTRSSEQAMKMMESVGASPEKVRSDDELAEVMKVLEKHIPNYSELFGSPDICECEHCRSVYSAAAYFVDLLRYLWRGTKNDDNKSPLEMLKKRRPDLLRLPLTCENTNTIIPYIDLVNEIMEYYTHYNLLDGDAAHDTGDTTSEELRANPQNFDPEAYKKLAAAVYPFSLPYHQPLDVIRTYSDHLQTARYDVMKALQKTTITAAGVKATDAEALRVGQEEYVVLTGQQFDGMPDTKVLHQYFGYTLANEMEKMAGYGVNDGIHEFLRRSGMKYVELVELIKTKFINPYQSTLEYLETLFADAALSPGDIYDHLKDIEGGTPPQNIPAINAVLVDAGIDPGDFANWVADNLVHFDKVITLYQSKSMCDLNHTYLRTVGNIYADIEESGIDEPTWSKIHRFIRLWRKLGWKLQEVDLMLSALGQTDITPATITMLSSVAGLLKQLKLPVNQLATFWGDIDTYGEKSLYKKLFLNKAVQRIDDSFRPDEFGEYLTDTTQVLGDHIAAIQAAFRMSNEDLQAIFEMKTVVEANVPRKLNPLTDKLNLSNLSTIYRYTTLARALKLKVADACLLIKLFGGAPFSNWDITNSTYINIAPAATTGFCDTVSSVKKTGFKPEALQYIFNGSLPAESSLGLNAEKTRLVARAIHDAFALIAQNYPDVPAAPLTIEQIKSDLLLSFNAETVNQLISFIESQQTFSVMADPGLAAIIPMAHAVKYNYNNGTGKLGCTGIVTEAESQAILNAQKFSVVTDLNLVIVIPPALATKFTYDGPTGTITCNGMMTFDELVALGALANATDNFRMALDTLLAKCNSFKASMTALFDVSNESLKASQPISVFAQPGLGLSIPAALKPKFVYSDASGRLTCYGVMSTAEQTLLHNMAGGDLALNGKIDELFHLPDVFIKDNFSGVFSDMNAALAILVNHPSQPDEAVLDAKLQLVYDKYIPLLRNKLREDSITQHIAPLLGMTEEATAVLVKNDLNAFTGSLAKDGLTGKYCTGFSIWNIPPDLTRNDNEINFEWSGSPGGAVPANNFSVRWESYLTPPSTGDYIFVVDVKETNEIFNFYIDDSLVFSKTGADLALSKESLPVSLNAAKMHKLRLDYAEATGNAGVSLSWKTATSAETLLPSTVSLPAKEVDEFLATVTLYHRASKFINVFKLDAKELAHFVKHHVDFDSINFKNITAAHWKRFSSYVQLRNELPQTQATLIDVFAAAKVTNPPAVLDDLVTLLNLASAWDKETLVHLVKVHFGLVTSHFKNEVELVRLNNAIRLVMKAGIPVVKLTNEWSVPEITDFGLLNKTAQLVKSTVKAKYEEADWFSLAGDLSNTIRENQKQALISYLLTKPALINWGAKDADGLFEYFLIDVQMGACMDTSRIVQANSSVQMFVNRCLLNLESDRTTGVEIGVSPEAVDKQRWEWMKNYRVWEANRKVFLYPENWLEPEWRDDRSPFFKELESELVQNDITTRSVETAFRNYLGKLNDVANLNVCGTCKENDDKGAFKYLHVVARNHTTPYTYYYRTWNQDMKWNAWEKMPVDIRGVEDGENSGVHVIPVVWKDRLFVFWPEFTEKHYDSIPTTGGQSSDMHQLADKTVQELTPESYWEIRLSWTEKVDDKWSPKQTTKEFTTNNTYISGPMDVLFKSEIVDNELLIVPYVSALGYETGFVWHEFNIFKFRDIQANVEIFDRNGGYGMQHESSVFYHNKYEKHGAYGQLAYWGNTYLQNDTEHKVLFPNDAIEKEDAPNDPFFYEDKTRNYFVRPVTISFTEQVREPAGNTPPIIIIVDDSYFTQPHLPGVGPDDYIPGPEDFIPGGGIFTGGGFTDPGRVITTNVFGDKANVFVNGTFGMKPMMNAPGLQHAGMGEKAMKAMSLKSGSTGGGMKTMSLKREGNGFNDDRALNNVVEIRNSFSGNPRDYLQYYNYGNYHTRTITTKGFEFHTFYHPHASDYITNLNKGGVAGLMVSDTMINSDSGTTFVDNYDPNFTHNFVKKAPPTDEYVAGEAYTYYKENVCFDVFGANSAYNWELFFHAPLYIATRLSKNGKYEEAMKWFHYIFDPTTDELPLVGQEETARYWKVLPFKSTKSKNLEQWFAELDPNTNPAASAENAAIAEWRRNPFKPHLVARNRPLAYMKNVVLKYVENLVSWGDSLFRMDTMESVNEATQIYVIANHILGPRPEFVPSRGAIKAQTYESLENKWDDFSNALVELENIFPYSSKIPVGASDSGPNLLGIGSALYFCIPGNEKLMEYWDTVTDRLFKIRHCMNIEGVERKLALFSPPIDPGMLVNAAAQGLSLGSILSDMSSPAPIYRFTHMLQRATDFCNEVKALGNSLLTVLEKKDGEELSRLRASHEVAMLELLTAVKERQVLEAKSNRDGLLKSRETTKQKLDYYTGLLGNTAVTLPAAPSVAAELDSESSLPADTSLSVVVPDVDQALAGIDERGVKLLSREKEELDKSRSAMISQQTATSLEAAAGIAHFFPSASIDGKPFGIGGGVSFGGPNVGSAISAAAKVPQIVGAVYSFQAAQAAKMASFIRREQEWTLQVNLASREIIQLDKQITSAEIRLQVTEKELQNHKTQIEHSKEMQQFLCDKFTNQELYQWMKEQLFAVYKQSYNLAYDLAKKAEKCFRYETGNEITSFIQYGYWDNTEQGLCSGEKLQLALRQLEKAYLEGNKRELELTKNVSMALLNPLALQELRASGKCNLSVPEELFDLDYQGHYFRRIKSVSLSIPCIAGPYTTVNCSLRLMKNTIRINTTMNANGTYEHENDEGILVDDDRFRSSNVPVKAIATSTAQRDSGMFDLNFRDERYLPFEGSGAISEWRIELTADAALRQFDYSTISDVIMHINYTAREDAGLFKASAVTYIKDFLANAAGLTTQPLLRMFSLKHEFPTEWYRFLHPVAAGADQVFNVALKPDHFPFFTQGRSLVVQKMDVLLKSSKTGDYNLRISATNTDAEIKDSNPLTAPENAKFGNMQKVSIDGASGQLVLEYTDIFAPIAMKIKHSSKTVFTALGTNPDELEDVFVVLHYALGE